MIHICPDEIIAVTTSLPFVTAACLKCKAVLKRLLESKRSRRTARLESDATRKG